MQNKQRMWARSLPVKPAWSGTELADKLRVLTKDTCNSWPHITRENFRHFLTRFSPVGPAQLPELGAGNGQQEAGQSKSRVNKSMNKDNKAASRLTEVFVLFVHFFADFVPIEVPRCEVGNKAECARGNESRVKFPLTGFKIKDLKQSISAQTTKTGFTSCLFCSL